MTETEIAWLAGLLEGEGAFMMRGGRNAKNRKIYKYPAIVLGMTDADVVMRAAELIGTSVGKIKNGNGNLPMYRVHAVGSRAINVMRAIRPYMGARRGQKIDELIAAAVARAPANERRRAACVIAAQFRKRKGGKFAVKTIDSDTEGR